MINATMDITIIGDGIAGNTTASIVKKHNTNANVTLISEESCPLYSPCVLPHYLAGSLSRDQIFLKGLKDYTREGIRTVFGERVESIDTKNNQVFLSNQAVPYDKLVIATGSEAIVPPIQGLDKEGIFAFKSLSDADKLCSWLGEKAVVIGSGFIGVEVAVALKKKGYKVHIVELLDWILPRAFDMKPAALLKELLEKNGIRVSVKEKVTNIIGNGEVARIITDKQEVKCDTVILAAGMKPNVGLAREMGLKIGKLGGIEVDSQMTTNIGNIYACGDCTETTDFITGDKALNLLWHNAKQQAEIVANNCLGDDRQYHGSMNITGVDIFGTQAVSIGITTANIHPERANDLEIIEKNWGRDYLRLISHNGLLIGLQSINRTKDIGFLFSAMLRKEDLKLPEKSCTWLFPYLLWQHWIRQCCQ